MSYEDIRRHISRKIEKVNVNNPKANWGARILKENNIDLDLIDDYLYWAVNAMQVNFSFSNVSKPAGRAGLTRTSMSIGANVLGTEDEVKKSRQVLINEVRVGDLFLEPFLKYGYISLIKPLSRDMMYFIEVTPLWETLGNDIKFDDDIIQYIHFDNEVDELNAVMIKDREEAPYQEALWARSAVDLMQVPWKINRPVCEALIANKHRFVSDVPIEMVDEYTTLQELRRRSRKMDLEFVTNKALVYIDRPFYMQIDADYRGRLYYREPFLNFQGSDWARGIFQFHEGKPLDKDGEYWLAIHTASSFNMSYDIDEIPDWCEADYRSYLKNEGLDSISVDKFTLNDRVRWFNEHVEEILYAGEHRLFSEAAEKPVAFLSCCVEWFFASHYEQGEYICHLPIPIDGSNNGWQHLGAISRDVRTGELVGLVAQEIQRDFYVSTAKQLLEIDDPKLNAMPMKHIRKGVSKRGSMTRAYSSGAATMAKNMWFDCRSEEFDETYDITEEDCTRWATGLIKAIDEVCPGPLQTMKYMQKLAGFNIGTHRKFKDGEDRHTEYLTLRRELNDWFQMGISDRDTDRVEELKELLKEYKTVKVSGNGNKTISWTSPSGFPVVYESYQMDVFKVRGRLNGKQIKHTIRIQTNNPNIRGYMSGISPNYIHSLDASHMALIIDEWEGAFGAIHDSFSTHACDVDKLVAITKDKFVKMYEEDNYFDTIQRNITGGTDNIQQPTLGSLEIQEVYDSDYFFA